MSKPWPAACLRQPNEADAAAGLGMLHLAKGFAGSSHPCSWVIWKLPLKFLFSAVTSCISSWTAYPILSFHFKFSRYKEMISLCRVLHYSRLSGSWKEKYLALVIRKMMRPTFLFCFRNQQQANTENPNKITQPPKTQRKNTPPPEHSYQHINKCHVTPKSVPLDSLHNFCYLW